MRKFEYKVNSGSPTNPVPDLETELNKAGDQGWELIEVVHFTEGGTDVGQKKVYHYFRREKEEAH